VLGYQDWVAKLPPVEVQELYRLVITGSRNGLDDLVIGGISSWQATNQAGSRSAYLQAVILDSGSGQFLFTNCIGADFLP